MALVKNQPCTFLRTICVAMRRFCSVKQEEGIKKKGLIIGGYADDESSKIKFTPAAHKLNGILGGKLEDLANERRPLTKGRYHVFENLGNDFQTVVLVGLGSEDAGYNELEHLDEKQENVRIASAVGTQVLQKVGLNEIHVESFGFPEAAAEGALLSLWKYQEINTKDHEECVPLLYLHGDGDRIAWQRGLFKAEAQNIARRLSDAPANLMTPTIFAQTAAEILCPCGINVEIRNKHWAASKRMNAFLTVAKGSCEPPIIVELNYNGGGDETSIAFVGKGITFDTGGLCMKKCPGMDEFRADMAGAAVVVAVFRAAATLSLPLNLRALIPLCENMPSGMAVKPGDVVYAMNGKSIQIDNTKNEGRLLLADALFYAQTIFRPSMLIDISTLTYGTLAALGDGASCVFTNKTELWDEINKAGAYTGDRVWRMPLWRHYTDKVTKASLADLSNIGEGPGGGSCRAAAFLREFINCPDWIHFDMGNSGMLSHTTTFPYLTKGRMTGRPTRTIIQFLYQLASFQE